MMRVCHICSNYDAFFTDLMNFQILNGIDLKVFYFRAKERGMPNIKDPYVDVRLNYKNWHRLFFRFKENLVLRDFIKLYNKGEFDLIHAHTLFSNGYIALQVKKRWGIPYIVAVRDVDLNIFLKYRFTLRKIGRDILRESEKIVFLSPKYKQQMFEKYVPAKYFNEFHAKSIILPNGINSFFHENKYEQIRQINVNEPLRILTVGYVSKRKNILEVCKEIDVLNSRGIEANYTVIGKVLDRRLLEKLKSYPFVRYIPFMSKNDLLEEYRRAHMLVMPSVRETFGLVYAEAMSQGLPVIYTKGQGFDGQFKEGLVGYSVDCQDYEEIASKIEMVVDNYDKITVNCINEVQRFDWDAISKRYIELYEKILQKM